MVYSRGKSAVPERRGAGTRVLFLVVGVIVLVGIASTLVTLLGYAPFGIQIGESELLVQWNDADYAGVAQTASNLLAANPLDGEALTFAGFAAFYTGIEAVQREEQLNALEESISHLRRADVVGRAPFPAERDYVLGKAYYHRGGAYIDLAIEHLEAAVAAGHESEDARTYLGLAHFAIGGYSESASWFGEAIAQAQGDEANSIRLRAAEVHVAAGDYDTAEQTLRAALASLEDEYLELLARNQLADVLIAKDDTITARLVLEQTIERYPQSADAYYYLGVIYSQTGESVLARDFWRRAIEIDPEHQDALRRLANREG